MTLQKKKSVLYAMLRIKDQIDTIDECLSRLSELVDGIVILDNGSTDGTKERYAQYPKIVQLLHTEGFDEGRDKIMLLSAIGSHNPDWILWLDGDEIFEKHMTREILEKYMLGKHNKISFRLCHFWLDKIHCRYDGKFFLYSLHPQMRMWRHNPQAWFANKKIHNGDIQGIEGNPVLSPYRIKHFGYIDADKMRRKHAQYVRVDTSGNRDYSHLSPDIPFRAYQFIEFDSKIMNRIWICFFAIFAGCLWIIERIRRKISKVHI